MLIRDLLLVAVIKTRHPLSHSVIPGPSASEVICVIIRRMIEEIVDTPPVMKESMLPDWEPGGLTMHNILKLQGSVATMIVRNLPRQKKWVFTPQKG